MKKSPSEIDLHKLLSQQVDLFLKRISSLCLSMDMSCPSTPEVPVKSHDIIGSNSNLKKGRINEKFVGVLGKKVDSSKPEKASED